MLSEAHFEDLYCKELWTKTGVKDRQRYISVYDIYLSLGRLLSKCMLSLHALTGSDFTSTLSGIGKKKAWNLLLKNELIQQDLCKFGENPLIEEVEQKVAEYFICSIYTFTQEFSNADDARYFLFCQQSLKSEELPSTSDSLSHHIKRANFQSLRPISKHALASRKRLEIGRWKASSCVDDTKSHSRRHCIVDNMPLHNIRVQMQLFL